MSEGDACPCCGKPWSPPENGIKAVPERNLVYIDGLAVYMQPGEVRILGILVESEPYVAHRTEIAEALWGLDEASWPKQFGQHISVRLAQIRAKLRPLGWLIENVRGRGYKLTRSKADEPTRLSGEDRRPGHDARRAAAVLS